MEADARQRNLVFVLDDFRFIGNPVATHQKAVAVDSVRGTGEQCHQILPLLNRKALCLIRLDHENLVDLVAEDIIQYVEKEVISFFEFVKIRKQGRAWQSPVCGNYRVGVFTANRKRTSLQMACCLFQDFLVCGVVDRDLDVDLRHFHISHHAVSEKVQAGHICLMVFGVLIGSCRYRERIGKDAGEKRLVEGVGFFPLGGVVNLTGGLLFRYCFVVAGNQSGLPVIVPFVGNQRIQQQGQTG